MMISAKCAQCISVIMQWIAGTLLHPSALYIYSASPAARDWRCFSIQVARKAFLPACSKFSLQSDTASNKWVERWGLRGGVRREQREGDSCPYGFGLLCLTEYLWITWNSTENTPNHTSNPTKRFGKGVKLEERVLIVMKTQDFLCFLSCFASFELGKLCFAFFSKLLPPTLLVYSLPDFLTARIVSCWRDENEELIVFHVFSNFLLRLSSALNALLSSFRGRLLNVSPTRFPLPLQPYGTM